MSTCRQCNHFRPCLFNHSKDGSTTRFYDSDIACADVEDRCPHYSPSGGCTHSSDDTLSVGDVLYDIAATPGRVVRFAVPSLQWIADNQHKINRTIFKDKLKASYSFKIMTKCPYTPICFSKTKTSTKDLPDCIRCNDTSARRITFVGVIGR